MSGYIGIGGVAKAVKGLYVGIGGVARRVKKAYIGVGGVARQFYQDGPGHDPRAAAFTYTGTMTDQQDVTINGSAYRLLTIKTSGTLTCDNELSTVVWMCNGGGSGITRGGGSSYSGYAGNGGCGGRAMQSAVTMPANTGVSCIVGAGNGSSSFKGLTPSGTGSGGTGGGRAGGVETNLTGDGMDKHPFGDTAKFPQAYCAGGGGGTYSDASGSLKYGYDGGTNGGDGAATTSATFQNPITAGGSYGGGSGGNNKSSSGVNGTAATYYGSGGGGGGRSDYYNKGSNGGAGYQGIIYVAIPYTQAL